MPRFPNDRRGSALIISLVITFLLSLMMSVLLERLVPISRQVKGIENSTAAFYHAESALEEAMTRLSPLRPGTASGTVETLIATSSSSRGFSFSLLGNEIPAPGQGTSEYDPNWNRISIGKPVQLAIPANADLANVNVFFRVPSRENMDAANGKFATMASGAVSWTLSKRGSSTGVVIADVSQSNALFSIVLDAGTNPSTPSETLWGMRSKDVQATESGTLSALYTSVLNACQPDGCTLKLSLLGTPKDQSGAKLPYLEYRITSVTALPLQYATVTAEGIAYAFKQTMIRKIRQLTTNEALDFAVLQ